MHVRMLGPLELCDEGRPFEITGPRRRALLAFLLVNAGHAVSGDQACEAVWPGADPARSAGSLKTYVWQFRKRFAGQPQLRIETTPIGYRLQLAADVLDRDRFERRLRDASRAPEPQRRVELLEAALSLWRGPALDEFRGSPWADEEGARLDALRLGAQLQQAEALLQLGRHRDAVALLEPLVRQHPLDEHAAVLLADGLAGCGRSTDGLRALTRLRRQLAEEAGLQPGPTVLAMEQRLLEGPQPPSAEPRLQPAHHGAGAASQVVTVLCLRNGPTGRDDDTGDPACPVDPDDRSRSAVLDACELFGGRRHGWHGDRFWAAFPRAADALRASERILFSLAATSRSAPVVLPRIGLHTGEAPPDDHRLGAVREVAQAVCAAARSGQVLMTGATRGLVEGLTARSHGEHELQHVTGPVAVYQLVVDGLPDDPRPPRSVASRPHNLPATLDEFVGRTDTVARVEEALQRHRLVSLTGTGGAGKTRLALEVAHRFVGRPREGVWLVELAPVADAERVPGVVAGVLGLGERPGTPIQHTLVQWLEGRELLLVLDNCEHVVGAAGQLAASILRRCSGVRLLVTSRQRLGVPGERVLPVPPLSLGGDAEQLFDVRARAAAPEADLGDRELVTAVCQRLDGLPLAIEVAAARLQGMSLLDLADGLDGRSSVLGEGWCHGDDRHRTLEAVVAWSYDLLDEVERCVFEVSSVFAGTFSSAAAGRVAEDGCGMLPVQHVLGRLVDKSLVLRAPDHGGRARYHLPKTIRGYAARQLDRRGRAAAAQDGLRGWALAQADRLVQAMRTPAQDTALRSVLPDLPNLRVALDLSLAEDRASVAALRIVSAAPVAPPSERRALISMLLPAALQDDPEVAAQAHLTVANLAFEQADWDASIHAGQEGARLFRRLGDRRLAAWCHYMEAFSRWGAGDEIAADRLAADVHDTFRSVGDEFGVAHALWFLSQREVDLARADRLAAEAEGLLRASGAPVALAHDLEGRGLIALQAGRHEHSARLLGESLHRFADAGNPGCTAHCLEAVGALLVSRGAPLAHVAELAGAADALRAASGHQHRPWELRGRYRIEDALLAGGDDPGVREGLHWGRSHDLPAAVQRAALLLGAELA